MTPQSGPATGPGPHPDPGRQPERTRLAWSRTVLALTVVALLTVRLALSRGALGAVLAAVAGAGWIAALAVAFARAAGLHHPGRAGRRAFALSALATAGYAGLGVLLLLGPLD